MAIVRDGILGPFQNKVGTVIGKKFRGLDIMTGLYEKRTNNPPTVPKLLQQERLGMLSGFLANIADLVELGFNKSVRKKGQSGVNAAFSYNFPNAFIETTVDVEEGEPVIQLSLNFPALVYSRGQVETPNCPSVVKEAGHIRYSWLPQAENMFGRNNDRASFLAYNIEKGLVMVLRNKAVRRDQVFEIELNSKMHGDSFHCWMSFSNADGKLAGDSVYVGRVD